MSDFGSIRFLVFLLYFAASIFAISLISPSGSGKRRIVVLTLLNSAVAERYGFFLNEPSQEILRALVWSLLSTRLGGTPKYWT